jgi:cardiolipin synthase
MEKKVNVPNALTAVRLLLAPVVFLLVIFGYNVLALISFIAAAITDILDGWSARRYGHTSEFGAKFDPLADKGLMFAAFLSLAVTGIVPWWFFWVVVCRDFLILLAAIIFLGGTSVKKFPPRPLGKISTLFQVFTVAAWILQHIFSSPVLTVAAEDVLRVSVIFTLWSAIDYAKQGLKMYNHKEG